MLQTFAFAHGDCIQFNAIGKNPLPVMEEALHTSGTSMSIFLTENYFRPA
jgi:hypothetical protein